MPCEEYREAMTGVAAEDAVPSRELRAHLEACQICREAFEEERQLLAAMDAGVQRMANCEVPASLLPRVRARLDEQNVSSFSWMRVGVLLASAALVLLSAVFLQRLRSAKHESHAVSTVEAKPTPTELPAEAAPGLGAEKHSMQALPTKLSHRRAVRAPERNAEMRVTESAVLIPAGQKEALHTLLAALRSGAVKSDVLAAEKNAPTLPNGELAPLGIPEIEIKRLAPVSEEPAPTR